MCDAWSFSKQHRSNTIRFSRGCLGVWFLGPNTSSLGVWMSRATKDPRYFFYSLKYILVENEFFFSFHASELLVHTNGHTPKICLNCFKKMKNILKKWWWKTGIYHVIASIKNSHLKKQNQSQFSCWKLYSKICWFCNLLRLPLQISLPRVLHLHRYSPE